jgi:predicted NBD/HSP70 family sugar kinase
MEVALTKNQASIVSALVRSRGGLERSALAMRLHLSRGTVSTAVSELIEARVLEEHDRPPTGREDAVAHPNGNGLRSGPQAARGRRARIVRLTRAVGVVAAIDMGRRHMSVGLVDANCVVAAVEPAQLLDLRRPRTGDGNVDVEADGPAVLLHAAASIQRLLDNAGLDFGCLRGVVVGVPAPLSSESGMIAVPSFLRSWAEVPIEQAVRAAVAEQFQLDDVEAQRLPIMVHNDANLCVVGEVTFRRERGLTDLVLLKVSSGVGAGFYLNGQLHTGRHGFAAEAGHTTVPPRRIRGLSSVAANELEAPRGVCERCGKVGCLEQLASGDAIARRVGPLPAEPGRGEGGKRAETPPRRDVPTLERIAQLALDAPFQSGCRTAIVDASLMIGSVLGDLATVLDPQLIVIAGMLAHAGELVSKSVEAALKSHVMLYDVPVSTVPRDRQPLIAMVGGGALLWEDVAAAIASGETPVLPRPRNATLV